MLYRIMMGKFSRVYPSWWKPSSKNCCQDRCGDFPRLTVVEREHASLGWEDDLAVTGGEIMTRKKIS